jgi:hypothetical protein
MYQVLATAFDKIRRLNILRGCSLTYFVSDSGASGGESSPVCCLARRHVVACQKSSPHSAR